MKGLKTCVVIVAEFITAANNVLEDKKINFGEVIGLLPQLMKIPKFVSNFPDAIAEVKAGIPDSYLADIRAEVSDVLNIENDKVEIIVEEIVPWLVYTSSVAMKIRSVVRK